MTTPRARQRILVIGTSTPLMEGVSDLLRVVGYPVAMSSTWADAQLTTRGSQPDLIIIDLSTADPEFYQLTEDIRQAPCCSDVPILFVSFSGDDRIRDLQRRNRRSGDTRMHFYAHTLLSMDGLLEKVRACLA